MTALKNSFDNAASKIYAQKYNTDLAIDNQNLKVLNTAEATNKRKEDLEEKFKLDSEAAKNAMLTTAIEQGTDLVTSNEKNDLAGKYNAMYADDYTFNYDTYLDRLSKILKKKKKNKK